MTKEMTDEKIREILENRWKEINPKHVVSNSEVVAARFMLKHIEESYK